MELVASGTWNLPESVTPVVRRTTRSQQRVGFLAFETSIAATDTLPRPNNESAEDGATSPSAMQANLLSPHFPD